MAQLTAPQELPTLQQQPQQHFGGGGGGAGESLRSRSMAFDDDFEDETPSELKLSSRVSALNGILLHCCACTI